MPKLLRNRYVLASLSAVIPLKVIQAVVTSQILTKKTRKRPRKRMAKRLWKRITTAKTRHPPRQYADAAPILTPWRSHRIQTHGRTKVAGSAIYADLIPGGGKGYSLFLRLYRRRDFHSHGCSATFFSRLLPVPFKIKSAGFVFRPEMTFA